MPTAPPGSSAPGGFTPPTPEELSVLLPQYEITAVLGIGGMGAVYKGRQPKLARDVAIKVLPADATGSEGDEAFNFAERFQREAQAMARLHHQRIISVHDFGEATTEEGKPLLYIVMEFVEGTDLNHLIKTEALTSDQMLAVVTQICDALHYAHEQGIVHRDIKPANIMLDVEGNVKVADFGLAKLTGGDAAAQSQLTMTNMAMGTPDYVSPEQLEQGREVDNRADIYSLGVMIYEMLTGAVPRGAFLPPSEKSADDLDPRLDEVVLKAMQADPETRYQQVSQLWTEVEQIRTTPRPAPGAVLHTGRVPVMGGGTGKVQILTGDTGKVATQKPASTQLPIKEPMDPARKKKIITLTLISTVSVIILGALGFLILAPTPTTDDNLATTETPKTPSEAQDKALAGRPDPHEPPTTPKTQTSPPLAYTSSARAGTPDKTPPTVIGSLNQEPGTSNRQSATGQPTNLDAAPTDSSTTSTPTPTIPEDAVPFAGNLYKYFDQRLQWAAAAETARKKGGFLVSIHSSEENAFVRSLLPPNPPGSPWIGLRPQDADQPWAWEDGTTTANFSVWNGRERPEIAKPDGTPFRGAINIDRSSWNPVAEGFSGPYIVEWGEPANLPTATTTSPALRSPQGEERDLLTKIGTPSRPDWTLQDGALTSPQNGNDKAIAIPHELPEEYTLEALVSSGSRGFETSFSLPVAGNRRAKFFLDLSGAKHSHLHVGSTPGAQNDTNTLVTALNIPVVADEKHHFVFRMRRGNLEALLDGNRVLHWTGNPDVLPNDDNNAAKGYNTDNFMRQAGLSFRWPATIHQLTVHPPDALPTPPAATSTTQAPTAPPTAPQTEAGQKIAALLEDARKTFNDTLGEAHAAKITTLNTNYRGALDRETKKVAATGNLDILLAWRSEIEALDALETGTPLHSPLHANAGDELEGMRATYRETIELYEGNRDSDAAPLVAALDKSLDSLQREFTQARKIDDALEVRNFREQLESTGPALLNSALPVTKPQSGNQKSTIDNQQSFTPLATPPPTDIDIARAAGTRGKLHLVGTSDGNPATIPGTLESHRDIVLIQIGSVGFGALRAGGELITDNRAFNERTKFVSVDHGVMHNIANVMRDGTLLLGASLEVTKQELGAPAVQAASHGHPGTGAVLLETGRVLTWRIANNGVNLEPPPIDLPACTALVSTQQWLVALGADGRPYAWHPTGGPAQVPSSVRDIVALAPGAQHVLALDKNGRVHVWGDNRDGQSSVPADLADVVTVRAGGHTSAALKKDGTWVAWGSEAAGIADKIRAMRGITDLNFYVYPDARRAWLYWTK